MIHLYGEVGESLHLYLPPSPFSATALQELDVDPDKVSLRYDGGFHDVTIEQIAWMVRREMLDPAPAGRLLVDSLATALGIHVLRRHSNLVPEPKSLPAVRGALDARRQRRVMDYIDSHLGEDLSISVLANEACLSPFHFARAFKAATGTAPHRYVTDRRIGYAKSLIGEGRLSLAEIAAICGFSSQSHLTRWFKRLAGTTPAEYRNRIR